jgi:hypothetical protein
MDSPGGARAAAPDRTGLPRRQPPADDTAADGGRPPLRRLLVGGAWTVAVLAAFAVYLRLASTRAVNSDGASQALQAWDMLHGNLLLTGWKTSDVSFYTTELPQYMLVELVRGLNQNAVHVAAAMTYTLVVLFAALVAKGTATGRQAVARVALAVGIMLAPQLDSGTNVLVSSPDHIGTSVPLLVVLLIIDRARPRWWVPVIVSLVLAWAMVADSIVLLAGVVPLAVVCAFRVARSGWRGGWRGGRRIGDRWYEIALGGGALVAVAVARLAELVLHALGGYTARPLGTQLAPLSVIEGHNLPIAAQALLLLPGADFVGLPAGASTDFVVLHLAGVALALAGIGLAAWRFGRREADLVSQLLLAGIVVNFAVFLVTTYVYDLAAAREIAPMLPLSAALAGREVARHLGRVAALALGLILAGYLAGLGLELSTPSAPPQAAPLTAWLSGHPLGTGLSGYWEASVVTLTSGGRDPVRPLIITGRHVSADTGEVKQEWFDPARSTADFVVLFPGSPGYPGFTDRQAVLATFGKPARTYHVGRYTILWWHRNLLTELR